MKMEREKYIARMARDIRVWSKTIEAYKVRASRGPSDLQAEYDQSIQNLQAKCDLLSSKLRGAAEICCRPLAGLGSGRRDGEA